MIILFILGILLGSVVVIFSLQNATTIVVTFFSWTLTGSLALVLLLTFASGIFISLLLLMPEFFTNFFKNRLLRMENSRISEELRKQKQLTVFAYQTAPTKAELDNIARGEIEESAK